jgi:hypothetical protein
VIFLTDEEIEMSFYLGALMQGRSLTAFLFPGKPFLVQVTSLEDLFWNVLWPLKVVWPGLNIQVSICDRILLLLEILGPPS